MSSLDTRSKDEILAELEVWKEYATHKDQLWRLVPHNAAVEAVRLLRSERAATNDPRGDRARRALLEKLEADAVEGEESREIIAELLGALAMISGEELHPCGPPCPGHLGEKASAKIREARKAWHGLEVERDELLSSREMLRAQAGDFKRRAEEAEAERDRLRTLVARMREEVAGLLSDVDLAWHGGLSPLLKDLDGQAAEVWLQEREKAAAQVAGDERDRLRVLVTRLRWGLAEVEDEDDRERAGRLVKELLADPDGLAAEAWLQAREDQVVAPWTALLARHSQFIYDRLAEAEPLSGDASAPYPEWVAEGRSLLLNPHPWLSALREKAYEQGRADGRAIPFEDLAKEREDLAREEGRQEGAAEAGGIRERLARLLATSYRMDTERTGQNCQEIDPSGRLLTLVIEEARKSATESRA